MSQTSKAILFEQTKFRDEKLAFQDFVLSPAQFKAEIVNHIQPIEKGWFEKGRLAGLAEADQNVRDQVMTKAAGVTSHSLNSARKSPEDLAARAIELREEAAAKGQEMTNIESVRAAFAEAGVPFR